MKVAAEGVSKDTRVVARVDAETQKFIAQAAELAGTSVSQFLIDSARTRAEEIVDRTTRIQVSVETGNRMLAVLDRKPRKPSSKLMQNAQEYRDAINETSTDSDPEKARSEKVRLRVQGPE